MEVVTGSGEERTPENLDWPVSVRALASEAFPPISEVERLEKETGRVRLTGQDETFYSRRVRIDPTYLAIKSVLDFVIASTALVLLLPLLVPVALLVYLQIGRPVLFTQKRVGQDGRIFTIYKFRTMIPNPDANSTATAPDDARITPLGRLLRRTHIDELPQLWNILIGDMSLIGPRPEQPSLTAIYTAAMPEFPLRTLAKPGLSGWAQVRFGYASTADETRNKLEYDLYYLFNRGPMLDAKIVFLTIFQLFRDENVR
jgi:lipopolysaccharide/colanic/teichoic acid biosynthesis glycosyltransferase